MADPFCVRGMGRGDSDGGDPVSASARATAIRRTEATKNNDKETFGMNGQVIGDFLFLVYAGFVAILVVGVGGLAITAQRTTRLGPQWAAAQVAANVAKCSTVMRRQRVPVVMEHVSEQEVWTAPTVTMEAVKAKRTRKKETA